MVRGICEGAWTINRSEAEKVYYTGVKYGTFIRELDYFYTDMDNVNIPVAEALKIISMQLRGEDSSVINSESDRMRLDF
jgi:hypothetical protein